MRLRVRYYLRKVGRLVYLVSWGGIEEVRGFGVRLGRWVGLGLFLGIGELLRVFG